MTDKYSATVADFFECSRLVELVNIAKRVRTAEKAAWDSVWADSAESVEQADVQLVVATRAGHARAAAEKTAELVSPSPSRVCNHCFNAATHRSIVHHFSEPGPCSICGYDVPRFCSIAAVKP